MTEFAFDLNMRASVRVDAPDEATARAMLAAALESASANLGAWPNGDPILAEASLDGKASLYLIEGQDAHDGALFAWPSDGLAAMTLLRGLANEPHPDDPEVKREAIEAYASENGMDPEDVDYEGDILADVSDDALLDLASEYREWITKARAVLTAAGWWTEAGPYTPVAHRPDLAA